MPVTPPGSTDIVVGCEKTFCFLEKTAIMVITANIRGSAIVTTGKWAIPAKGMVKAVAFGMCIAALPSLANAATLSIAPVLLSKGSTSPVPQAPSMSASAQDTAPLNLKGYAQWKSPKKTLEMVGYGTASVRSSYGSGVPLKDALRLILPSGWRVYAKPGVSGMVPVTWKGKDLPWTVPLREVLRQSGLIATINWPHEALLLKVKPVAPVAPMNTTGYREWNASSGGHLPAHFHEGPATVSLVSSLAGVIPVFVLNRGDLILTDLQKWARQSGWTVIWQVPEDWQVPNTTTFSGSFQKAVSQVIQALAANGANVHAVFHTANNTVVISGAGGGE
jgi:hypothetical protein